MLNRITMKNFGAVVIIGLMAPGFWACSKKVNVSKVIADAEAQTKVMLAEIPQARQNRAELVSPRTLEEGKLKLVPSRDWTSGFFPGVLWFLHEKTNNKDWRNDAHTYTTNLEREKTNGTTHDMGFKIYCSYGNGYRLTNAEQYKSVIIESAKTLITRFKPTVGTLRSWNHSGDKWAFPVIIDNMMNLELLFAATRISGDSTYYNIAVSHANTTMKNHFREDYSAYHVINYDTITGVPKDKHNHQGYSHASAWSRGQAWALYGYTMCYRETKDPAYLEQAEGIAAYLLNHPNMPQDMVAYWDFNAPNIPNEERDASAAAIMASGLYELSTYSANGGKYKSAADKMVYSLTKKYRSPIGENKGFILLHSTGSKAHKSEVDVPLIYGDYYYMEAVLRSEKLKNGQRLW